MLACHDLQGVVSVTRLQDTIEVAAGGEGGEGGGAAEGEACEEVAAAVFCSARRAPEQTCVKASAFCTVSSLSRRGVRLQQRRRGPEGEAPRVMRFAGHP